MRESRQRTVLPSSTCNVMAEGEREEVPQAKQHQPIAARLMWERNDISRARAFYQAVARSGASKSSHCWQGQLFTRNSAAISWFAEYFALLRDYAGTRRSALWRDPPKRIRTS